MINVIYCALVARGGNSLIMNKIIIRYYEN